MSRKKEDLIGDKDLTGKKFGKLNVIEYAYRRDDKFICWKCKCDCGNEVIVFQGHLKSGAIKSCGCFRKERAKQNATKGQLYDSVQNKIYEGTFINRLVAKTPKNNTSGVTGVSWNSKSSKWCARIGIHKKRITLGYYENKEDAIKARKEAEEKYFKPIIEEYKGNEDTQY